MNRKQRFMEACSAAASRAFNEKLELSTTFTVAAVILAMDSAHCKVNYDKWFSNFAEIYPQVLEDPKGMIKKAEEIIGGEIEFHWT